LGIWAGGITLIALATAGSVGKAGVSTAGFDKK